MVNESELQQQWGGAIPSQTSGHDQGSLWFLIEVEVRGFLRHDSGEDPRASHWGVNKRLQEGDCDIKSR